ncbi:NRDE family protein [Lysinibacillus sp. 54212]|uniref:NRDE family protein n=1 Tax=Lysinibacillus sp. 54212 TaxID=3119829 RepID=UPI002FC8229D
MCILVFQYNSHPKYKLIVAANRDEFYHRPTAPAHFWEEEPHILAGKDLQKGGTWLGVNKDGRFVAITNYRDPKLALYGEYSRGNIATRFLKSNQSSKEFIEELINNKHKYGPFNILAFDGQSLLHYNNYFKESSFIQEGVHCLCNATINTPWPKVTTLTQNFKTLMKYPNFEQKQLFQLMLNRTMAQDDLLPSTGVPLELERELSPIFVRREGYGTRCSTVVLIDDEKIQFTERTFTNGEYLYERNFTFPINK